MVPAALGSQTAGSLIRPASYCGVHAFKPTLGMIPRAGVLMQSHTLDTVGIYGRSVDDLALLADAMAAFEPGDAVSYERDRAGAARDGAAGAAGAAPLRLRQDAGLGRRGRADARGIRQFADRARRLALREIEIPVLADVIEWQRIVQLVENAHYYGPLMKSAPELLSDGLKARLEAGLAVAPQVYAAALDACEPAYRTVAAVLDELRCDPDACGDRPGAGGPRLHRQPDLQRPVELPRHAGGIAAAAGSRRLARRRAARRQAPRRRARYCAPRAGSRQSFARRVNRRCDTCSYLFP